MTFKGAKKIPAVTPTLVILHHAAGNEAETRQALDASREQLSELDITTLTAQEIGAFQDLMKEVVLPLMHPFVCVELNTGVSEDYNVVLSYRGKPGLASDFQTHFKRCLSSLKYRRPEDDEKKSRWETSTRAMFVFKKTSFWSEGGMAEFLTSLQEFFEEQYYVLHSSMFGGNNKNFYTYRLNSKKCPSTLSGSARLWGRVFLEKNIPEPQRSDISSSSEEEEDEVDKETPVEGGPAMVYDEL